MVRVAARAVLPVPPRRHHPVRLAPSEVGSQHRSHHFYCRRRSRSPAAALGAARDDPRIRLERLQANRGPARPEPRARAHERECVAYRVGETVQRGANAGDFAAINEIDVLLGLCDPRDPFYASIVAEKLPFVPPDDQPALRELGAAGSLLARFEAEAEAGVTPQLRSAWWWKAYAAPWARQTPRNRWALFVKPFLERPAAATPPNRHATLSASGPPLEEVIAVLERLRNLRTARAPLARLRELTMARAEGVT